MRPFKAVSSFLYSGLALALSVSALSSAEAAVYRGKFTPDYGAPFTSLYWNGSLEVYAPDNCIPAGGGTVSLLSCSGMEILSATVNLYNKGNKGNVLQSENFTSIGQLNGLNWSLNFDANQNLIGASSTAFSAFEGGISETVYSGTGNQAWFSLQFLGDYAQLYWFDKEPLEHNYFGVTVPDEVVLTAGISVNNPLYPFGPQQITIGGVCRDYGGTEITGLLATYVNPDNCGWSDPDGIRSQNGAFITFERVPEPATLALVPLALGAMGFASVWTKRRRRSSAA